MISIPIRNAILLTLSFVLALQAIFLPLFLIIFLCIMLLGVWLSFKRQIVIAKTWKFLLVVMSLAAVYLSYRSFVGIEAGVALMTIFLFAKALESKTKRDFIILFNFALFVVSSSFLYSQSIFMAIGTFAALICCLVGLYRIQSQEFVLQDNDEAKLKHDARYVTKFVLYAIPFFILLFLFFPRLPPLWHIPIPENKGVTGISDSMSPGDIAQLSQSTALAFRIIGDIQQLPPRTELYWRALVLDEYDGQTWKSSFINQQPLKIQDVDFSKVYKTWDYEYLAADPSVLWIMGLEKSLPIESRYYNRYDWGIVSRRLTQRVEPIKLRWIDQNGKEKINHPQLINRINTKTVNYYDVKAQALAKQIFQQANRDPKQYIQQVLNWYKDNNFIYTLTPGLLGQNRIDEFLFQSRQGFCEHYASSFVMLMRYVGIPARVVTGYQGGQMAPDAESWEVRQLDAHAWAEVLVDNQWQRVDPTAIIAPQRIDEGMQTMLAQDDRIFGQQNALAKRRFQILNEVRIWSDYATYQWQSKVVGYNAAAQQKWFEKLGLNSIYSAILVLVLSLFVLIILYLSYGYWSRRQKKIPLQYYVDQWNKRLHPNDQRLESETVKQWFERISADLTQNNQLLFFKVIEQYNQHIYGNGKLSRSEQKKFVSMLKTCTYVLKNKGKHLS